jgi:hypothetical protein
LVVGEELVNVIAITDNLALKKEEQSEQRIKER